MHRVLPILAVLLLLPGLAGAQEQPRTALDRARGVFAAADADGDGRLDGEELAAASIRTAVVGRWDEDGDRHLTRDEFLLYYRQLLVDAGRPLGRDLVEESERIWKARAGESAGRERGDPAAGSKVRPGAAGEPTMPAERPQRPASTAEAYRRARAALEERLTRARRERSRTALEAHGAGRVPGRSGSGVLHPSSEVRSRLGGTMALSPDSGALAAPRSVLRGTVERADLQVESRGPAPRSSARRVPEEPAPAPPSAAERRALERGHALLEARARRAGWSEQQLAGQKLRLLEVLRAGKESPGARQGDGHRNAERGMDREERRPEDADPEPGGQGSPPARRGGGSGPPS